MTLFESVFARTRVPGFAVGAKRRALLTVSSTALALAASAAGQAAFAQSAPQTAQAQTAQGPAPEEIVVTGTRIIRNGYEAPTPLTVVSVEQMQSAGTENIADYVNTMPAFAATQTPYNTQTSMSGGTSGINALNLRSLGAQRTLVLLDGQRSVGINTSQLVDVNLMPQALVSRVDVVTGGASAAYGSDALAGVVNFVLDKTFTGIKGDVSGGVTTYGDDRQWGVDLTGGTGFADDRGHFLIDGSATHIDGIPINNRKWNLTGAQFMSNPGYTPTNGQPQFIYQPCCVSPDNGFYSAAVITSGPLKGTAFGPGGSPFMYQYGTITFDPDTYQSPDFAATQVRGNISGGGLDSAETTQSIFTRTSYDLSDNVEVFLQWAWAHNSNENICCARESNANLTVLSGNPFIPAAIQAQMTALKITSLTMGSQNFDLPDEAAVNDRRTSRYVVGANGRIDAFDTNWTWNAYYQKGVSFQTASAIAPDKANFAAAMDAVTNPATGAIVCRSTLTNPGNGCVPYNVLGENVNSQAAINYVMGQGSRDFRHEHFTQDVLSASASGEPFSDWAGPVSIATGIEHRAEHVNGINDPISSAFGWFVGNYQVYTAGYNVTEGFVETVVPLAKDLTWAKSLDLNAAVRATGYSTSGYVTTWKVGATWAPIDDIKFRATRSRDIRAPNLLELFNAGGGSAPAVLNDFLNNASETLIGNTVGNPNLQPEKSDTTGAGVVLQPTFIPGFSASVDYWNLDIHNAISTLTTQQIVDQCYAGNQAICRAITFTPAKVITEINIEPFNLVEQIARGIDFEASYSLPLATLSSSWNGNLAFRFLATNYIKDYSNNGITAPQDVAGQNSNNGVPSWRWTASAAYDLDPVNVMVSARGVSGGTFNNAYVVCTSACPASTSIAPTYSYNHVSGAVYFDTSFTYKFAHKDQGGLDAEAYLNIRDITNKGAVIVAQGPGGFNYANPDTNAALYDVLGRVFRAGIRFKM